ncbi:MAG: hypothetical protein NZ988_03370 [Thaumarchaeota archaeon]|nr:hypothetical protein [Candidatus Calditenuaceae archaeon]MDW8187072.1 hypothetical protein [Nitrososphaerota archaeon]
MEGPVIKRTTIAVRKDLLDQLSALAKERKMSVYALSNSILEQAIEVIRESESDRVIVSLWRVHKILKDFDAVVVPSHFMDKLIVELYRLDKEKILAAFAQLGRDIGTLARDYARTFEELISLSTLFVYFFPLKRIELKEVGNDLKEVTMVGVGGTIEATEAVYETLREILGSYGVTIVNHTISRGLIKVTVTSSRS